MLASEVGSCRCTVPDGKGMSIACVFIYYHPANIRAFLSVFLTTISYVLKCGEVWFDFPFQSELDVALAFIFLPSMLNAFKWYKRSQDPSFDGWF